MRIAEVVGRVTLAKPHRSLKPGAWIIVRPMTRKALQEGSAERGEELVAFDQLGARPGDLIGLSEGGEAANPFGKEKPPIDAYCACILDHLHL
jgi:ethanolamine utilization protein EutN